MALAIHKALQPIWMWNVSRKCAVLFAHFCLFSLFAIGKTICPISHFSCSFFVPDPAKVTFTPTVQYLPFRLAGVVQCYIKSNPPLQYVTWTKDKRLLEPYQTKDIVIMNNGSLLFTRVNQNHQGRYTCTPYNAQGTQGSSGAMEVLVRKPPAFTIEPDLLYQRKVGESVEMACDAQEAEGTQRPNIQWLRRGNCILISALFHSLISKFLIISLFLSEYFILTHRRNAIAKESRKIVRW